MKKGKKYKLNALSGFNLSFEKKGEVLMGNLRDIRELKDLDEDPSDAMIIEAISAILPVKKLLIRTPLLGSHEWTHDFKEPPLLFRPFFFFVEIYLFFLSFLGIFFPRKFFSSHVEKIHRFLHKHCFKQFLARIKSDGLQLIESNFEDLTLTFTLSIEKIPTYIDSLADYSLNKPDYLMASNINIENDIQLNSLIDFDVLRRNIFYGKAGITEEWKRVEEMLESFLMIGVLYEGDFRFYTKTMSQDEIITRLKSLTESHHLKLVL